MIITMQLLFAFLWLLKLNIFHDCCSLAFYLSILGFDLCVYMHACVYEGTHVFSHAHLYVCACGEQGTTLGAITQSSSILSFEICSLTGVEFTK